MALALSNVEKGYSPSHNHIYTDFDIDIGPGDGFRYPITVLRSPAGEARASVIFPYSRPQLEQVLLRLEHALLRSGGQRRTVLTPDEATVQEFGAALFDAVFHGEIRNLYDVSLERAGQAEQGLRLKLRINAPELAALPWEFLFDTHRERYIALSKQTPIIRYLELSQSLRPLAAPTPLRILGVVASPRDLAPLDVENEKQRVETATADLHARGLVELTWLEGQSWRDLQRAMYEGPWHIVHFVGHGYFDAQSDEGHIALADADGHTQPLSATKLAHLLTDHPSLRLVLLNVCEGAKSGAHNIFSSAASILVRQGIPAVLAMQYEITDQAAIECARSFYQALAFGLPVDAAVAEARKGISLQVTNSLEWGVPVLYMRTADGVLFDMADQPAGEPNTSSDSSGEAEQGAVSSPNGVHPPDKQRAATPEAPPKSAPASPSAAQPAHETNAEATQIPPEPAANPGSDPPSADAAPSHDAAQTPPQRHGVNTLAGAARKRRRTGDQARPARSQFQLFPSRSQSSLLRPVHVQLMLALVLSWLAGGAIFWFVSLSGAGASPWVEALAWSAVGVTQFALTRRTLSWAGQWIVSSALGWSLGWLIGWSLHWSSNELMLGDAVWAVMGAIAYTIGALLVTAFRRENLETKTVTVITAAVSGAAVGYGLWYAFGDALHALWPLVFAPLAIYGLAGLAVTVLYLSLFNQRMRWYTRIVCTLAAGALIGGISWSLIGLAHWAHWVTISTAAATWVRAGNLAGVLAGVQLVIAWESVRRRAWPRPLFLGIVLGLGILGGTGPVLAFTPLSDLALIGAGSLVILAPLPFWIWLYETDALILQLSAADRALSVDALSILRRRGWTDRPLLQHATLRSANLTALDLTGLDLRGANLLACDLTRARLDKANLAHVNLSGSLLIGCALRNANLNRATMRNTVLTEADLRGATLRGVDLSEADLHFAIYDSATVWPTGFTPQETEAIGPGATLRKALLSGIDLSGCDLSDATLIRADLSHARLAKANLTRANLRAADLKGADLSGAQLQETNLKDARFDEATQWPGDFNPVAAGAVFVRRMTQDAV